MFRLNTAAINRRNPSYYTCFVLPKFAFAHFGCLLYRRGGCARIQPKLLIYFCIPREYAAPSISGRRFRGKSRDVEHIENGSKLDNIESTLSHIKFWWYLVFENLFTSHIKTGRKNNKDLFFFISFFFILFLNMNEEFPNTAKYRQILSYFLPF